MSYTEGVVVIVPAGGIPASSTIEGISNPGGDLDIVTDGNILVAANDTLDTITFSLPSIDGGTL